MVDPIFINDTFSTIGLYEFSYIIIPAVLGIILSIVGLYNEFKSDLNKALISILGSFYLILSAIGAALFTQVFKAFGMTIVSEQHQILNCILLSLIGAGTFLE